MTIRQGSAFAHTRQTTGDGTTVTVSCSASDCEWTATVEVGPHGAQNVFAEWNRHIRSLAKPAPVAYPYAPGVPAAGHVNRGFWHPGKIEGCPKCS